MKVRRKSKVQWTISLCANQPSDKFLWYLELIQEFEFNLPKNLFLFHCYSSAHVAWNNRTTVLPLSLSSKKTLISNVPPFLKDKLLE